MELRKEKSRIFKNAKKDAKEPYVKKMVTLQKCNFTIHNFFYNSTMRC
jgi:hypothetical protein